MSVRQKNLLPIQGIHPKCRGPNTHVPVVVCRSAGIWTRGQLTALERPAAGGKPAHPAQRGTRLEATTDRAFLVSVGPPKVGLPKRLVYLAGRAEGNPPFQTMALNPNVCFGLVKATAQHLALEGSTRRPPPDVGLVCLRLAGQREASRVSIARGHSASPAPFSWFSARPRRVGDAAMTDRIKEFMLRNPEEGPRLVVDLDVVRENYSHLRQGAAGHPGVLRRQGQPGAGDPRAARPARLLLRLRVSLPEIEQALAAGATPDRISFGNTIKKERDVARAFALGVGLYAVDCEAEVEKIARVAPGSRVFCRILSDGAGAEWPLSRKFGCAPEMAASVLERAHCAGPGRAWPVVPCRLAAARSQACGTAR